MLAEEPVIGVGPPVRVDFQVKVDGWRLDDMLVRFGGPDDERRRWAVSVRSGQQIRSVVARDFAERAWAELLGDSGSGFDLATDLVGLAIPPLHFTTKEMLEDLIGKAHSQDPLDLDRRIKVFWICERGEAKIVGQFSGTE